MQFNTKQQQQQKHRVEKFILSSERVQIYINLLFMFVAPPFYSQLTRHKAVLMHTMQYSLSHSHSVF